MPHLQLLDFAEERLGSDLNCMFLSSTPSSRAVLNSASLLRTYACATSYTATWILMTFILQGISFSACTFQNTNLSRLTV